jgi:hypothetical protein
MHGSFPFYSGCMFILGNYAWLFFLPPAGLEMRPDNAAAYLADAQSGRREAAKEEKRFFGDTPNPGKGLRPLHSLRQA